MQYYIPDVSTLRRIRSLSELSEVQLIALANQLQTIKAKKGDLLIEKGSVEDASLYVLKGKISFIAADGRTKHQTFTENGVLVQVAQLRPSIYDVLAQGEVEYLKINKQKLVEFALMPESASGDISVHSLSSIGGDYTQSIVYDLYRNIMRNEVELPCLPSAAIKINQLYRERVTDAGRLSHILSTYPEVSNKLINGQTNKIKAKQDPSQDIWRIADRLGTDTAYYMIMTHVINRIFLRPPERLIAGLNPIREHSLSVAAISRVLAKDTVSINPDNAMLAGISHGIGDVLIVDYLLNHSEFGLDDEEKAHANRSIRAEFSSVLLNRWNFSEEIIRVSEGCEDWFRNPDDAIDLCDVVLVANYHSLISSNRVSMLPPISSIPAMRKMGITQEKSIDLIKRSKIERVKIEKLIR
ncbi:MAG: HD-like signal output (HDOD) protein [Gammaproteobacteria bacterium]|jgi:HD-like signal output (HDOD) protein